MVTDGGALRRTWLLTLLLLGAAGSASAQSTDDGSVFDFSLPGARSRGMGGAFVAIADDASSVYSNPAGLMNLFRPEVSIEMRAWNLRSVAVDHGHVFGNPTNIGIDTVAGRQDREFSNTLFSPTAFFSAVYPGNRWAIGVFHHQLVNYEMSQETQGAFFDCVGGQRGPFGRPPFCEMPGGVDRIFPANHRHQVGITSSGVGVAFEIANRFKVGGSLQMFGFNIERVQFNYSPRANLFAATVRSNETLETSSFRIGTDRELGFNAGALWEVTNTLTVGGTFRQGQTFHYSAYNISGPANPPGGTVFTNNPDAPFRLPDTWAVGIAYKPNNSWRVGFEYDLVRYGQLADAFVNNSLPPEWPEARVLEEQLKVKDASQFRAGLEYSRPVFGGLLSVRGGSWSDPFHQPYFETTDEATGMPAPGWALYFPKGDGQVHYSGGAGFAAAQRWQVDFAVDHARTMTTYSLSAIIRF
jgi:long-subunit fatty acid transport protein